MVILLMAIGEYSIGGYWWLLMDIILVVINVIILLVIGGYSINDYWWLFHYKPLAVILLVAIDGYFIGVY